MVSDTPTNFMQRRTTIRQAFGDEVQAAGGVENLVRFAAPNRTRTRTTQRRPATNFGMSVRAALDTLSNRERLRFVQERGMLTRQFHREFGAELQAEAERTYRDAASRFITAGGRTIGQRQALAELSPDIEAEQGRVARLNTRRERQAEQDFLDLADPRVRASLRPGGVSSGPLIAQARERREQERREQEQRLQDFRAERARGRGPGETGRLRAPEEQVRQAERAGSVFTGQRITAPGEADLPNVHDLTPDDFRRMLEEQQARQRERRAEDTRLRNRERFALRGAVALPEALGRSLIMSPLDEVDLGPLDAREVLGVSAGDIVREATTPINLLVAGAGQGIAQGLRGGATAIRGGAGLLSARGAASLVPRAAAAALEPIVPAGGSFAGNLARESVVGLGARAGAHQGVQGLQALGVEDRTLLLGGALASGLLGGVGSLAAARPRATASVLRQSPEAVRAVGRAIGGPQYVYHGTPDSAVESIRASGLQPRIPEGLGGITGSNLDDIPPSVFFADSEEAARAFITTRLEPPSEAVSAMARTSGLRSGTIPQPGTVPARPALPSGPATAQPSRILRVNRRILELVQNDRLTGGFRSESPVPPQAIEFLDDDGVWRNLVTFEEMGRPVRDILDSAVARARRLLSDEQGDIGASRFVEPGDRAGRDTLELGDEIRAGEYGEGLKRPEGGTRPGDVIRVVRRNGSIITGELMDPATGAPVRPVREISIDTDVQGFEVLPREDPTAGVGPRFDEPAAAPVQGGLPGVGADQPTFRPENAPTETQGRLLDAPLAPGPQPPREQGRLFEAARAEDIPATRGNEISGRTRESIDDIRDEDFYGDVVRAEADAISGADVTRMDIDLERTADLRTSAADELSRIADEIEAQELKRGASGAISRSKKNAEVIDTIGRARAAADMERLRAEFYGDPEGLRREAFEMAQAGQEALDFRRLQATRTGRKRPTAKAGDKLKGQAAELDRADALFPGLRSADFPLAEARVRHFQELAAGMEPETTAALFARNLDEADQALINEMNMPRILDRADDLPPGHARAVVDSAAIDQRPVGVGPAHAAETRPDSEIIAMEPFRQVDISTRIADSPNPNATARAARRVYERGDVPTIDGRPVDLNGRPIGQTDQPSAERVREILDRIEAQRQARARAPRDRRAPEGAAARPTRRQEVDIEARRQRIESGTGEPPEPPRPPRTVGGDLPPRGPRRPNTRYEEPDWDAIQVNDAEAAETALGRYEGEIRARSVELDAERDKLNRMMRDLGIARRRSRFTKDVVVERTPEVEQLFKALHGEAEVPERFRELYDAMRRIIDTETVAMSTFDGTFIPRPDYFPRFWKQPESTASGLGKGPVGSTRAFQKARKDATFSEMLDDGWEPYTWNPVDMMAQRIVTGIEYRTQQSLVQWMRARGQAIRLAKGDAIPDGYRIPEVGPAFSGRPIIAPARLRKGGLAEMAARFDVEEEDLIRAFEEQGPKLAFYGFSPRYAVERRIADRLETMFGRPLEGPRIGEVDMLQYFTGANSMLKQLKLFGSFFQQVDFANRTGFALFAGALDDFLHGDFTGGLRKGAEVPLAIGRMAWANSSPARRRILRERVLSGDAIVSGRNISFLGIVERGWQSWDKSIVRREIQEALRSAGEQLAPDAGTLRHLGARGKAELAGLNEAFQRGLFDGVYVEAQMTALKNFIVPRIIRAHPNWTDDQVMAQAAREVNVMFSTLGDYQTMISSRGLRNLTHNLLFSANESESLIRQAINTVHGPNQGLWREYWVGGALYLAMIANGVHFAATGDPLPLDRYSPIEYTGEFSLSGGTPFGIRYNSRFLSPNIPGVEGRAGTELFIDLMGQMDTVFRILEPGSMVGGRLNVAPRAVVNQIQGHDFFGRPMEGDLGRLKQLARDVALPIGAGQFAGALNIGGPGEEARIGDRGQFIQGTGVNVRGETNEELRNRIAREQAGALRAPDDERGPITSYDDLEPGEQARLRELDPEFAGELEARRAEFAETVEGESARASITIEEERAERTAEQENDDRLLQLYFDGRPGGITPEQWRDRNNARKTAFAQFAEGRRADIEPFDDGREPSPLDRYFDQIEQTKDASGIPDWDAIDVWRAGLSDEENAYIDRNTGLGGGPFERERRELARDLDASGFFDIRDTAWSLIQQDPGTPEAVRSLAFDEFVERVTLLIANELEASGLPEGQALNLADGLKDRIPLLQLHQRAQRAIRLRWAARYPELAEQATRWQYFDPAREAAGAIIGGLQ